MKSIVIYQDGAEKIELFDEDDRDNEGFALELSNALKSSTVSIINTSSGSLIVRPSKINSILVQDQSKATEMIPKPVKAKVKQKKEVVDIITDVDT